jgi:glyoxylase-like metal-dependent hydrolase (beta-lactamase superfamily II)
MYFRLLHDETTGAVSYLLGDLEAGEAVLIDPRGADVPVLSAMLDEHRLRLRWVLRTHEHDDRLQGETAALDALGAPRVQHRVPPAQAWPAPGAAEGEHGVIVFGHEHLQVRPTPGHTAGCLSYLWRDRLFCGGLLAVDACPFQPRPALPDALWNSVVHDVFTMPSETLLFTGHATQGRAVSNVLEQRRWHPWFAGATRDDFLARVQALPGSASPSPTSIPTP